MKDSPMIGFCESYKLHNLIKQPTCFRNPDNPSCIDSLLTNKPLSFRTTFVIKTGMSDFRKVIVAVMKMHFRKTKPQINKYCKYELYRHIKADLVPDPDIQRKQTS